MNMVGHTASAENTAPDEGVGQDHLIFELCGIMPDTRRVPLAETQDLIRGTREGDPSASERLVATRLHWIYDTYAQKPEVRSRLDMEEEDILQIGALATIEAAHLVDPGSPEANTLLHTKIPIIMGSLMARSKLVPARSEAGHKLVNVRYWHHDERIAEDVEPVGTAGDVISTGSYDRAAPGPHEPIVEAEDHEALMEAMDVLDDKERYIISARYGVAESADEEPATLSEVGRKLGVSHELVRRKQARSLKKMRAAWQEMKKEPEPRWTQEQLTAQRAWLDELRARQDAGEIVYVKGSLLKRPLPAPIEKYLATGYFARKAGVEGLHAALKAARKQEEDREWFEGWSGHRFD